MQPDTVQDTINDELGAFNEQSFLAVRDMNSAAESLKAFKRSLVGRVVYVSCYGAHGHSFTYYGDFKGIGMITDICQAANGRLSLILQQPKHSFCLPVSTTRIEIREDLEGLFTSS